MNIPFISKKSVLRKPETATLAACLLLALYIGFLMLWIYESRMALGESIVNRYRLDVEKQVASIGYFFSERRYDVRAIAASREIATYFLNKTLGMSEQFILITRFGESERQHDLLSLKNRQLEVEFLRRKEAENELEAQRTLSMRSDRLRSLGEMAAGIAHELNQPLLGVRGLAELILMSMGNDQNPMSEQNRKNVGRIVEQADRMVHIINHVRMFAREAGKTDTSRVDLNEVVRSGVGLLAAQLKSHGLHLEQEMTPCPLPVQVNPYSIVEEFDGYIQFESTEGVSSAFKIDFPTFLPEESSDGPDQSLKYPDCG